MLSRVWHSSILSCEDDNRKVRSYGQDLDPRSFHRIYSLYYRAGPTDGLSHLDLRRLDMQDTQDTQDTGLLAVILRGLHMSGSILVSWMLWKGLY